MPIIYEPKGKAAEYSPLAANLYRGCDHACEYCYAPSALRMQRDTFHEPAPRKAVIEQLKKDVIKLKGDKRPVLLCFTCDPYQQIDEDYKLTRQALNILLPAGMNIIILTKGGRRSERDFDILQQYKDQVQYATTLVFVSDAESLQREPGAAPTSERIASLKKAHECGIKTWVSLEPVYYAADAHKLIEQTADFVDLFKVGKLNYRPEAKDVNWKLFAHDVKDQLDGMGVDYYIKDDLRKYL